MNKPPITSLLDTRIAWLTDLSAYGRADPLPPDVRNTVDSMMMSRRSSADPRELDRDIIAMLDQYADA